MLQRKLTQAHLLPVDGATTTTTMNEAITFRPRPPPSRPPSYSKLMHFPWTAVIGIDGKDYFYNSVTSETTWELPGTTDDAPASEKSSAEKAELAAEAAALRGIPGWFHSDDGEEDGVRGPFKIDSLRKGLAAGHFKLDDIVFTGQRRAGLPFARGTPMTVAAAVGDVAATAAAAAGAVGAAASGSSTAHPVEVAGLPDGWEAHATDGDDRIYYHHAERGETSWDLPSETSAAAATAAARGSSTAHPVEVAGLPDGWEAHATDGDGHIYYHHAERGETSWDLPSETSAAAATAAASGSSTAHPVEVAGLPNGWEAHATDGDGHIYYHHAERGETSWELPSESSAAADDNEFHPVAVADLPPGWEAHANGSGGLFYHNASTGETQWDLPDHLVDALAPPMPEKAGVKAKKKKKKKFRSSKKPTEQEGVMRDPQGKIANLLHTMFNEIDRDQGGTISTGELCKYLRTKLKKLDISGNLQQQMLLSQDLDEDGNGEVDLTEFIHGMMRCKNHGLREHVVARAYPEGVPPEERGEAEESTL